MKFPFKRMPRLLKLSFAKWKDDNAMRLAASLAYYTAFSLAPLLLAAIALGGLVFGDEAASGRIYRQLEGALGHSVAAAIEELVQAARKPVQGILGAVVAFALVLFGASGVFGELKDALNIVWKQQRKEGSGIWTWIRGRFLSIGMVLGVCFLLLVSLVINTALGVVSDYGKELIGVAPQLVQVVGILFSFGFIVLLFALLFKFLPDTKVEWDDDWIGSIFTALLFTLGKTGLEIYISKAAVASAYGAAGALALVLVWVYYSAQIFLMGAEFTAIYAEQVGSRATTQSRVSYGTPAETPSSPVPPPIPFRYNDDLVAPALERFGKTLGVDKPGKLKPSRQWARLLGAGLALGAIRSFETLKEKRKEKRSAFETRG
jgi:membrane protein